MKLLGFAIVLLLLPFGFVACSDSDDDISSPDAIIGTWESVWSTGWEKENGKIVDKWDEEMTDERVVFKENGRFVIYYEYNGRWNESESGSWELDGSKLFVETKYDEMTLTVVKLNSKELVIRRHDKYEDSYYDDYYEEEETITYHKVAE